MKSLIQKLSRKKYVDFDSTPLPRVLGLLDLTALGVGSTVGVGFYILAGQVARDLAGPAVVLCFLIAGIASIFSGLCYAEFGARVPKAGSAYVYSYVCVGEFVAFVIGWNLILEYVIGSASVARGYSGYIDTLFNNSISDAFREAMPINVEALSAYPDFLSFSLIMVVALLLIIGVKESTQANNVFTVINVFVIIYTIIAGCTQIDTHNWNLSYEEVNYTVCNVSKDPDEEDFVYVEGAWGTGGFAPYGFNGIMNGAATCFFGFVGFDVIATTGEETIRPERNIPLSICLSLMIVFLAYFGMSTVLTLALPYCLEDSSAALIEFFAYFDMNVSKWIVSVGAIFGFSASLLGCIFPMPRIIYAMAGDGLIFRFLGRVNKRFKTPLIATLISSLLAAIMALLFNIDSLVDMMSIGTLMAYTIVSVCVMLLRYSDFKYQPLLMEYSLLKYIPDNDATDDEKEKPSKNGEVLYKSGQMIKDNNNSYTFKEYFYQIFNQKGLTESSELTSSLVNYATLSFCIVCFLFAMFIVVLQSNLVDGDAGAIFFVAFLGCLTFFHVIVIWRQPMSKKHLSFKVPLVPWIPALSAFINLYLMCNLSGATWIRFAVWMAIGLAIYIFYGYKNSSGNDPPPPSLMGLKTLIIPTLLIQPPTPSGSRQGTPATTIKPPEERRQSIIEWAEEFGIDQSKDETNLHNDSVSDSQVVIMVSEDTEPDFEKVESSVVQSSASPTKEIPPPSWIEAFTKKPENEVVTPAPLSDDKPEIQRSFSFNERKRKENVPDLVLKDSTPQEQSSSWVPIPIVSDSAPPTPRISSIPSYVREEFSFSSSVPGTPSENKRNHPTKLMRRACSFEFIPPSAPDSPSVNIRNFRVTRIKIPSECMATELSDRLTQLQNEEGDNKSPQGLNLELDTIRERGESKISFAPEEEVKIPVFTFDTNQFRTVIT